uniref:Uncharacterized protein n=1 Tax=Prasinoderma singulare TaxID=676789 RepID=A0A7S3C152_9VIRI|mmetsp:Transcript_7589/g.23082  ORF Transcript_7589/g.23082 Transcript_7589/m.23082 type:complete len:248 (+) Transcript_7589:230-973(+)
MASRCACARFRPTLANGHCLRRRPRAFVHTETAETGTRAPARTGSAHSASFVETVSRSAGGAEALMRLENAYKLDSGSGSGGNNKGGEGGGGGGGGGGGDGSNRWESVLFSFLHAAAFFALSLFGFSHVARGAAAKANASAGASAETQARSSALRSWCRLMSMALLFVTLPYLLPLAVLCARASVSALQRASASDWLVLLVPSARAWQLRGGTGSGNSAVEMPYYCGASGTGTAAFSPPAVKKQAVR